MRSTLAQTITRLDLDTRIQYGLMLLFGGLCLLAAARNEQLLYDVSRWGEEVGLASKATFSRTKTALENAGLVGTEKVPIDVGRPRLRLTLAPELAGQPVDALAREARDRR